MKKFIAFILFTLALTSCYKVEESGVLKSKEVIISRLYTESTSHYGYHYGYSVMKGKFCWHYGQETTPEKYEVSFTFLNDTISWNDYKIYKKTRLYDTISIYYRDRYHVEKDKKEFLGHQIFMIKTNDTTLKY